MEFRTVEYNSVDYVEMVELRNTILLEPIGLPYFEDVFIKDEESIFCGCYDNGELVGCCVLTEYTKETVQLRQMAVMEEFQKSGIGSKLISFAEDIAKQDSYEEIMLHAQRAVETFYLKNGYHFEGDEFIEAGIRHIIMKKRL